MLKSANMPGIIEIREARREDASDLGKIQASGWHFAYQGIVDDDYLRTEITPEAMRLKWEKRLPSSDQRIATFISTLDGETAGFAGAGPGRMDGRRHYGELYAIYVDPAYYGFGIGRVLFTRAMTHLQSIGYDKMYLKVLKDNNIARSFYENMGGVAKEEFPDGLKVGDKIHTDLIYEWSQLGKKAFL